MLMIVNATKNNQTKRFVTENVSHAETIQLQLIEQGYITKVTRQ